jgi:hypothetical protein
MGQNDIFIPRIFFGHKFGKILEILLPKIPLKFQIFLKFFLYYKIVGKKTIGGVHFYSI